MDVARDLAVLHREGIDENELIHAAAEYLREHPRDRAAASPPLSRRERRLLRDSGAIGLDGDGPMPVGEAIPVTITVQHQRLVAEALAKEEVSERLGVVDSRVRQRVREGSLYVVDGVRGRVFPRFQFDDDVSGTLPGLRQVLAAIEPSVHPVLVARFFRTPAIDLEYELDGRTQALSPRDWLLAGLPIDDVVLLARGL